MRPNSGMRSRVQCGSAFDVDFGDTPIPGLLPSLRSGATMQGWGHGPNKRRSGAAQGGGAVGWENRGPLAMFGVLPMLPVRVEGDVILDRRHRREGRLVRPQP